MDKIPTLVIIGVVVAIILVSALILISQTRAGNVMSSQVCGDGFCASGETNLSCPGDCPFAVNGKCTMAEDCELIRGCNGAPLRCSPKSANDSRGECPSGIFYSPPAPNVALVWTNTFCDCVNSSCRMLIDTETVCKRLCDERRQITDSEFWDRIGCSEYECDYLSDDRYRCRADADCGVSRTANCCGMECRNVAFLENCTDKECTDESYALRGCTPLECGSATCGCINGRCNEVSCIGEGKNAGSNEPCCGGLKKSLFYYELEGRCKVLNKSGGVCINCGDGECGQGENRCNCPEDCEI